MRRPFGNTGLWFAAFVVVAALVIGGLAWVTVSSLRVEAAQREATARADRANQERLALWRLDGHLLPAFGLENNRPFGHYSALHTQFPVIDVEQSVYTQNTYRFPSPLLSADLPPWMLLHFQIDPERGWESPQVIDPDLADRLRGEPSNLTLPNVGPQRDLLLAHLRDRFPADVTLSMLADQERTNPDDDLFVVPVPFADEPAVPKPPPLSTEDELAPGRSRPQFTAPLTKLQYSPGAERKASPIPPTGFTRGGPAPPPGGVGGFGGGFGGQGGPGGPGGGALALENKGGGKPGPETPAQPQGGRAPTRAAKTDEQAGDYGKRNLATQQQLNVGRGNFEPPAPVKNAAPNEKQEPTPGLPMPPASDGKDKTQSDPKQADLKKTMPPAGAMPLSAAPGAPAPGFGGPPPGAPAGPGGPLLKGADEGTKDAAVKTKEEVELAKEAFRRNEPQGSVRGEKKTAPTVQPVAVHLGTLRPYWLTAPNGTELLVLVRAARMENKTVYQGVVLDWEAVRRALAEQIADLFPAATLTPIRSPEELSPERAMTALPAQLDTGPAPELPPAGSTPLRFGLSLAWVAALLALTAVGFGGRALIALSERRIRFVSAVTHELRTPLTSLRLYLDLLTSGLVEDPEKQKEYLNTLASESDRLNRLIENVLDFAKLEKRSVQAVMVPTPIAEILEQLRQTWADRCAKEGKELVVQSLLPSEQTVTTDLRMAAQVLGNLIDNSRKYSRDAADNRIWVWAKPGERGRVMLEVEDRGPGVASSDRGSVFRAFRRGETADTTCGGAGLGLALAAQWADLLGGTLSYRPADGGVGACFRLELPGRS